MLRFQYQAWRLALLSLLLAMLTGAALRFAFLYGLPLNLRFDDVRHAHSHLMFFSWATPVLMLFAAEATRRAGGRLPGGGLVAVIAAVAGLIAYLPFLLSGYRLMQVAGRELPLSMMASGLNGLVWYLFAVLYVVGTWRLTRHPALRLLDGAVVLLLVSSVGAVLLAASGIGGTATPVTNAAFVDLFLTLFADGWFGVGVLAALVLTHFSVAARTTPRFGAATWLLTFGLAARSLARLAADAYGVTGVDGIESGAAVVAAVSWGYLALSLVTRQHAALRRAAASRARAEPDSSEVAPAAEPITDLHGYQVAVAATLLIALKALVELIIALPAGERLYLSLGLRVLFLHAFLLGAVTLGLLAAVRGLLAPRVFAPVRAFAWSVLVLVACLVPLTGVWPASLAGRWMLWSAAGSSLVPPLIVAAGYATGGRSARLKTGPHGTGTRRTGLAQ